MVVIIRCFGGNQYGYILWVNCVSFVGDGESFVVSGGFDIIVCFWDVKSGSFKLIQVLDEVCDVIICVVVRGLEVVIGSVDGWVRIYDVWMG